MIEVLIDHSYEEDYFMISDITVKVNGIHEKERIERAVKEDNLVGSLVDGDRGLSLRIADVLKVNVGLIDLDTNEIDI